MKRTWLFGLLILVILISGCTGQKTENQPATTNTVDIKGFAFIPDNISVIKGTNVTWTNRDSAPHTVTGIGNVLSSDILNEGQTYSYTFNESGTFEYQCHIHPNMRGKVTVT